MIALRWCVCGLAAISLSGLGFARCAEFDWPETLAASLAQLDDVDSVSLPSALGPAISFAAGPCRTRNLPSGDSATPVVTAMLVYADEKSCEAPSPLVMLQVYIEAKSAGEVDRLRRRLVSLLPAPCFSGRQSSDPRRHAPPHELVAWKLNGRLLSLGQDAGHASAVGISFVSTNAVTISPDRLGRADKSMIDQFEKSLPAECR